MTSIYAALPPLAITFISSIIALGSAADACERLDAECKGKEAWAVACATLSTALTLIMLVLIFLERLNEWLAVVLGVFLSVWWCFGVGFNTSMGGVFQWISNGYFSSWFCLFGAFYFTVTVLSSARDMHIPSLGPLAVIFIASIVEFSCAANVCAKRDGPCTNQFGFAVAVGVVSTCISAAAMILHHCNQHLAEKLSMWIAIVLFTLWAFGAGFNTSYVGPFNIAGDGAGYSVNGYFSTWVAFFASAYYVVHEIPVVNKAFHKVANPERAAPSPSGVQPFSQHEEIAPSSVEMQNTTEKPVFSASVV